MALALSLAGLTVSAWLARVHAQAHGGAASFCELSETVSCDRVALSRFSVQLGLPVAVWGMLGYALTAGLAASGLFRRRPGSSWPAGSLLLVSAAAAVTSVGLAVVSKVAIGAWCLLCVSMVAHLLWLGRRCLARLPGSRRVGRPHRGSLRGSSKTGAGALLLLLFGGLTLTSAAYPRYWERGRASVRTVPSTDPPGTAGPAQGGTLLVFEYTDYECPFCVRMHEETRALAGRQDVTLVRRHFPLDPACNPAVKRRVHPSACTLARAGICADAQGRLAEMEDALFTNRQDRAPVETLASRLGLDLERFRACLSSPETDRRLAADVATGIREGVRATPSYVVNGTVHSGRLPPELLRAVRDSQSHNGGPPAHGAKYGRER